MKNEIVLTMEEAELIFATLDNPIENPIRLGTLMRLLQTKLAASPSGGEPASSEEAKCPECEGHGIIRYWRGNPEHPQEDQDTCHICNGSGVRK